MTPSTPRPQWLPGRRGVGVGIAIVVTIGLLLFAASAWLFQRALPSSGSDESVTPGTGPVARFRYYRPSTGKAELFVEPAAGVSLSDLFDMSLFQDAKPGMTLAEFKSRYGASQLQGLRAVLEAGLEEDRSTFGTVTFRPIYAYPKAGSHGIDLVSVVNVVVSSEIERSRFDGELILTGSADGERLFCLVEGGKIFKIRWVGAAA
jgi:hypothetical protein